MKRMKYTIDPMSTYDYWMRMSGLAMSDATQSAYAHHAGLSVDFMLYTALTAWMEAQ